MNHEIDALDNALRQSMRPLQLAKQAEFRSILILSKKQYVACIRNSREIIERGTPSCRMDSCKLVSTFISDLVQKLLSPVRETSEWSAEVQKIRTDVSIQEMAQSLVMDAQLDVKDLVIRNAFHPRTISSSSSSYSHTPSPFDQVVQQLVHLRGGHKLPTGKIVSYRLVASNEDPANHAIIGKFVDIRSEFPNYASDVSVTTMKTVCDNDTRTYYMNHYVVPELKRVQAAVMTGLHQACVKLELGKYPSSVRGWISRLGSDAALDTTATATARVNPMPRLVPDRWKRTVADFFANEKDHTNSRKFYCGLYELKHAAQQRGYDNTASEITGLIESTRYHWVDMTFLFSAWSNNVPSCMSPNPSNVIPSAAMDEGSNTAT